MLQVLAAGPLSRAELAAWADAAEWGPGRLDAVVAHGVATGCLVETGDGAVRAHYADRTRGVDDHSARAKSTAGTPITRPPTTAEPGRSKNRTCASTDDP